MPGTKGSGNTTANRGRKLRTRVFLSEDAARALRALLAAFPGYDEDQIVAELLQQRWALAQGDALAPPVTANGHAPAMQPEPMALFPVAASVVVPTALAPAAPAALADALDLAPLGGFQPSAYQRAVFRFILHEIGNALIAAVAGSGKTTTILQAAKLIEARRQSWMFLAFNASIEEEINHKLSEVGMKAQAKTAHKVGLATLFKRLGKTLKPSPQENKYRQIARNYVIARIRPHDRADDKHCVDVLVDLARLARLTLTDPASHDDLLSMGFHYDVAIYPDPLKLPEPQNDEEARKQARQHAEREREIKRLVKGILAGVKPLVEEGVRVAEHDGVIDFTDMVYLPHRWGLLPKPVDFVLVDECQDLSAAVLDLAMKCAKPDEGRHIFVGDRAQAIYGFAGADDRSFDRIIERAHAKLLPLSICYRCPASHVRLAREIVDTIEPRPDAPEGVVASLKEDEMIERLRELAGQAMVICRLTAPLVSLCIKLIGKQINAKVRGREIGEQLVEIVEAVGELPGATYEKFGEWLAIYEQLQVERLRQRSESDAAPLVQALQDRVTAVQVCYEAFAMPTAADLKAKMRSLFAKERPDVWLSTIHKSKGLEEKHVFIYCPDKLPLIWNGQQEWQFKQEMNLRYVALTRAKEGIYFVPKQA